MLNFEKLTNSQDTPRLVGGANPEEIFGQLNISEERYTEALDKFRIGNLDDIEYLQETKVNLIAFANEMATNHGTLSTRNKEILDLVKKRLAELENVLQGVIH
ncbi:MAG: hypothetical protein AAB628_02450 [Patescibacteria group bacterium]